MPTPQNSISGPAAGTRSKQNGGHSSHITDTESSAEAVSTTDQDTSTDSDDQESDIEIQVDNADIQDNIIFQQDIDCDHEEMGDNSITPPPFAGASHEDAKLWWNTFTYFAKYKKLSDDQQLATFPLLLRGPALQWFEALEDANKDTIAHLQEAFKGAFGIHEASKWSQERELFQQNQGPTQSARDYINTMKFKARELELPDAQLARMVLGGLKPSIRAFVLQQPHATTEEISKAAILAEAAMPPPLNEEPSLIAEISVLKEQLAEMTAATRAMAIQPPNTGSQSQPRQYNRQYNRQNQGARPRQYQQRPHQQQQEQQGPAKPCHRCGKWGHVPSGCFAKDLECYFCGKKGHINRACRFAKRQNSNQNQ